MAIICKYDPTEPMFIRRQKSIAIDNLLSVKMESELEDKIQGLLQKLILTNDEVEVDLLKLQIKNIQRDITDLQTTREKRIKRSREFDNV